MDTELSLKEAGLKYQRDKEKTARIERDTVLLEDEIQKLGKWFDQDWINGYVPAACWERSLNASHLLSQLVELNRTLERGVEDYMLVQDNQRARRHGLPVEQITAERHAYMA